MDLPLPANALEFDRLYGTEEGCRRVLFEARWPKGFRCPRCDHGRAYELRCRKASVQCARCGAQVSLTAGTLFHASNLPLSTLFRLTYMIVAEKSGTNGLALSRQTGISHPTALLWIRKIRTLMARRRRRKLSGTVEMDEAIVGGRSSEQKGRRLAPHQAWVVIVAEDKGEDGMGRVRLEMVEAASEEVLTSVARQHVEQGSEVRTDAWMGYQSLGRKGYHHDRRSVKASGKPAHKSLPLVHLVASLLKRHIKAIVHGSWRRRWLPWLLADFEFRFNRRRSRHRPLLFNRLLEVGIAQRTPTRDQFGQFARMATCGLL